MKTLVETMIRKTEADNIARYGNAGMFVASEAPGAPEHEPAGCLDCRDRGWVWDYYYRVDRATGKSTTFVRKIGCGRCDCGMFWAADQEKRRAAQAAYKGPEVPPRRGGGFK